MSINEIDKLINQVSKLPGLGRRSAQRITLYLLQHKELSLKKLIESLEEANNTIVNCENCQNIDLNIYFQTHYKSNLIYSIPKLELQNIHL